MRRPLSLSLRRPPSTGVAARSAGRPPSKARTVVRASSAAGLRGKRVRVARARDADPINVAFSRALAIRAGEDEPAQRSHAELNCVVAGIDRLVGADRNWCGHALTAAATLGV